MPNNQNNKRNLTPKPWIPMPNGLECWRLVTDLPGGGTLLLDNDGLVVPYKRLHSQLLPLSEFYRRVPDDIIELENSRSVIYPGPTTPHSRLIERYRNHEPLVPDSPTRISMSR